MMPPFEIVRLLPAMISLKSLAATEPTTKGSLGVTTTSWLLSARALRILGELMSAGTSAVAEYSDVLPPLVRVAAILPPAGGSPESGKLNAPEPESAPEPTQVVGVVPSGSPP